jgi:hypothetical protein
VLILLQGLTCLYYGPHDICGRHGS